MNAAVVNPDMLSLQEACTYDGLQQRQRHVLLNSPDALLM